MSDVRPEPSPGDSIDRRLDAFVADLRSQGAIRSPSLERAFRRVARHRLLETFFTWGPDERAATRIAHDPAAPTQAQLDVIYSDRALGTRFADGMPISSTSQPSLMARMLESLDLSSGMHVLEIGAGTGYNAAIMRELVGAEGVIVSVDIDQDVVAQTQRLLRDAGYADLLVLQRDGFEGAPEYAPFDRIIATVCCPDLSPAWRAQLAPGGAMVIPLDHASADPLTLITNREDGLRGRVVGWSGFVDPRGLLQQPSPWERGRYVVTWEPRERSEHVREDPVWNGFAAGQPVPELGCPADVVHLGFFLALCDPRANIGGQEAGLVDGPRGWALASQQAIRSFGDPDILSDLHDLHRQWTALGRPSMFEYELAFEPFAGPPMHHGLSGAGRWIVDRGHHRQVTHLRRAAG